MRPSMNNFSEIKFNNSTAITKGGFSKVTLNAGASAADSFLKNNLPLISSEGWNLVNVTETKILNGFTYTFRYYFSGKFK
jgi:hypothetical protein